MTDKKKINKHEVSVTGEPLPCSLYIDGYLETVLRDLHIYKENNFDGIGLITGEEGSGKTTLAMQMSLFMDPNFSNKNIVFNADQFEEAIVKLPHGSCILWDEADDVGSGWATEMLRMLKKTFKRIRKRNFIVLLVTPTFHDLNKYFTIHRTRFLIDVYSDFVTRGYFRFFNKDKKKLLYIKGKKEMDMKCVFSNFYGKFSDYPPRFPIDMDAYEEAKDFATNIALQKEIGTKDIRVDIYQNLLSWAETKGVGLLRRETAAILGISERQVSRYKAQVEVTK